MIIARYGLSPYITQIHFVLKGLKGSVEAVNNDGASVIIDPSHANRHTSRSEAQGALY